MTSLQCRRGMDIKHMKNFVTQELKGLKQQHRLLSLHRFWLEEVLRGLGQKALPPEGTSLFIWQIMLFLAF